MDKLSSLDLFKAGKDDVIILICKNDCEDKSNIDWIWPQTLVPQNQYSQSLKLLKALED